MNTAIFVLVAQAYSETQRPRTFTFISTAWVLPSFVGPPVAAWLTEQLSWHWVFYAVVPMVVGGGLLVLPILRRMRDAQTPADADQDGADRKSTRLNSSHANISYAVFCLKKQTTPPSPAS